MNKTKKVLRTLVVLGLVGGLAAVGAFSAFSSQTDNPGNQVTTGTVTLSDNDANSPLYNITNGKPGSTDVHCIRVTYSGSLASDVRIYRPDPVTAALADHVNVVVTPGNGTAFDCSNFVADVGAPLYDGTLSAFPSTYAGGVQDYPGATTSWTTGNAVTYRVSATVSNAAPDTAQGLTTGSHRLRWEAQNQ
jgi:predicted ribosomally synthesized peptide with SipW-like signal peptide